MRSKRTKALDIPLKVRKEVLDRDDHCIFCGMGECEGAYQIMHYIPRSAGGLGIPRNLAVGCAKHHAMLDQGIKRAIYLAVFKQHLKDCYTDWNKDDLTYRKEII